MKHRFIVACLGNNPGVVTKTLVVEYKAKQFPTAESAENQLLVDLEENQQGAWNGGGVDYNYMTLIAYGGGSFWQGEWADWKRAGATHPRPPIGHPGRLLSAPKTDQPHCFSQQPTP